MLKALAAVMTVLGHGMAAAPNWAPSAELEAAVRNIAETFMSDMDEGRAEYAYILLSEDYKSRLSLSDFTAKVNAFNAEAGTVTFRRIANFTWAKDSPGPGVHVAIDVEGRFANIARRCDVIFLHQGPDGGLFRITGLAVRNC